MLYLSSGCNLYSIQIRLGCAHSFAEPNLARIDVHFTTRLVSGLSAVPQAFNDDLCVAHKYLRENLVEVVLLQLHFDHLLRVLFRNGELDQRLVIALFERHAELAKLFKGFQRVALFGADHRLDLGEF